MAHASTHGSRKPPGPKGKLMISLSPEEEKKELVSALMVKCHKTEEEVLMAYEEFYLKHEDGFISKEEYTNAKRVNIYEPPL